MCSFLCVGLCFGFTSIHIVWNSRTYMESMIFLIECVSTYRMHIECTANAPCPTCPTCPGRQTQNWGLTRPRRRGPAQWPWPWQPWSWKNALEKTNSFTNCSEFRNIQNVSTKVWTKVSKRFQIIDMTSDEGSSFKMFQLHWSLRSRISRSPQRYTKYLRLYWQKPLRIPRFLWLWETHWSRYNTNTQLVLSKRCLRMEKKT